MDFLHALPIELWRDIFHRIPTSWIYSADISSDPLVALRSHKMNEDTALSTQIERASGMLICKRLLPVAEEALYSEVYLGPFADALAFESSARRKRDGRKSAGWWTRRISLDTRGWPPEHIGTQMDKIAEACPNVTSIHLEHGQWRSRRALPDLEEDSPLFTKLRTLTLRADSVTAQDIADVSVRCPHLEYLHVEPIMALYGTLVPSVIFGNLKRLSTSWLIIRDMVEAQVSFGFSQLEWLSVELTPTTPSGPVTDFCLHYGNSLEILELRTPKDQKPSRARPLDPLFLDHTPVLKTLIVSNFLIFDYEAAVVPHTGLDHLIVSMRHFMGAYTIDHHRLFFSDQRFPNLRRLTIAELNGPKDKNGVVLGASALFPRLQVENRTLAVT